MRALALAQPDDRRCLTLKVRVVVLRGLVLVSAIWAFVLYMNNWRSAREIYRHAAGYRPAEFVVLDLSYEPEHGSGRTRFPDTWYARGRLGEAEERFNLAGYLDHHPTSIMDLRSQVAIGSRFAVLYNPEVQDSGIAGQTIRVLRYREDFLDSAGRRLRFWTELTFTPLAVSAALLMLANFVLRDGTERSATTIGNR
jgi:hypothetical protein